MALSAVYNYDPDDLGCEGYDVARRRVAALAPKYKKFYGGEVEDLVQTALVAVFQLWDGLGRPKLLPEEPLLDAVTRAVVAEVRANTDRNRDAAGDGVEAAVEAGLHPTEAEFLEKFREAAIKAVGDIDFNCYYLPTFLRFSDAEVARYCWRRAGGRAKVTPEQIRAARETVPDRLRLLLPPDWPERLETLRRKLAARECEEDTREE